MRETTLTLLLAMALCLGADGQTAGRESPQPPQGRYARFYPNPAVDFIRFDIRRPAPDPLRLRVFNFLGKMVLDIPRIGAGTRVDLTDLRRGIYIYQLSDAAGKVRESGKFQVER